MTSEKPTCLSAIPTNINITGCASFLKLADQSGLLFSQRKDGEWWAAAGWDNRLVVVHRFLYLALLFPFFEQTHHALVACDAKWATVPFYSMFWYPPKWCTYGAVWLSHGWRSVKLLPSWCILCTPYNHALCRFMLSHIQMESSTGNCGNRGVEQILK